MKVQVNTVEGFLQTKVFNLRKRLWEDHGASAAKLDLVQTHLEAAGGGAGLTGLARQFYASRLHGVEPMARQLVAFVEVPPEQTEAAVAVVREYLAAFTKAVQVQETR